MKQHSKRLLSVLLALALVLSLFPGVALIASAADDIEFVQITSTPTEDDLANMINYDQTAALALYNSAEFQALASASGGVALIYNNSGEEDGEYMVIHNLRGEPEVISTSLATIGMLIQVGSNVYIAQRSGSVTPPTPTNPAVYYRYYTLDTSSRTVSAAVSSTTDYTLVSAGDANGSWNGGWHVVNGNVVLNGNVNLTGTVNLILCDGASLTVTKGLYSNTSGTRLVIYPGVMSSGTRSAPEIQGTGTLTATGTQGRSAIGYELSLEVHGGVIEANGFQLAAGIGGIAGKDGCDVVIYDGTVNATGGENAAGIGGGLRGSGGNVEIYGGTVNAVSGADDVAGIGAGAGGSEQGTLSLYNTELSVSNDGVTWTPASDSSVRGRYMRVQAIDLSAPVSADDGYTDGFEGANTWTIQNGDRPNAWYVGEAVNNGGSKALYISNDGGVSNSYTVGGSSSFVFAEKRFRFEGGYYDFAYDWRNKGESNFDYLRVALIPESAEVRPGDSPYSGFGNSALPDGWIALDGGSQLSGQNDWQHMSVVGQSVPEGVYRVAFLWWNDSSAGTQPPAAIDNFSVAVSDYEPPAAVSADAGYTDGFEGENTWILQNGDRTNAWVVGEAVSNGGSKALYISNDGGANNAYNIGNSAFVFAEKRFSFDGGNYNFEYDWHSNGEVFNSTHYDFLRVALVPDAFVMKAGEYSPSSFNASNLPSGWIALDGGSQLDLNSEWQHASFENIEVPAGVYRVAFIWRNDGSGGSNPPAAVDNFSVVNSNAPQTVSVSSVTVSPDALNLSADDTATLAAEILPAEADQTVVWTSSDPSVATVDANGVVTAVGPGEAVITATATNGTEDASDDVAASCTVTVAEPVAPEREVISHSFLWSWEGEPAATLRLEWSDGVLEEISMDVTPSEAQGVITYTATAEKDGTTYTSEKTVQRTYTVTVEGGSITSGEKDGYSYGDKIIVTAGPAPEGKAFAGWYIGEDLVSTSEVYGRCVDRDLALVARYDDQPVVVRPTVTASNTQRTASGDGYKTTLTVSWSVPKGYTMVEAGIYRAYANNQPSQATLVSKGSKKASTLKKANGVYNLNITIGAAKKNYGLYYVGYVTYKNARGETLTEYSTIGCSAPVE